MKRSIEDTPIVFIGAGNLATNLAKALYRKGFRIVQVYSRTMESARTLAEKVEAEYTTDLQAVSKDAKLYIVSLKDDALVDLLPQITEGKQASLLVHTAGSIPMSVSLTRMRNATEYFIRCRHSANNVKLNFRKCLSLLKRKGRKTWNC